MPDIRYVVFTAISLVVLIGTAYSVWHNMFLDTSNPLLTHLPHPLGSTHYYANKSNFLNVYFIKKTWAWAPGAFLLSWFTSPASTRPGGRGLNLFERVILVSGGECVLNLPSGEHMSIPTEYCLSRTPISPNSHPSLFIKSLSNGLSVDWRALPRLRRGHDVSGHIFLLTMSVLFLADQARYSFRIKQWSMLHGLATGANLVLICTWLFATWTTSLYFHSPMEKISGYAPGVAGFFLTLLPDMFNPSTPAKIHTS